MTITITDPNSAAQKAAKTLLEKAAYEWQVNTAAHDLFEVVKAYENPPVDDSDVPDATDSLHLALAYARQAGCLVTA